MPYNANATTRLHAAATAFSAGDAYYADDGNVNVNYGPGEYTMLHTDPLFGLDCSDAENDRVSSHEHPFCTLFSNHNWEAKNQLFRCTICHVGDFLGSLLLVPSDDVVRHLAFSELQITMGFHAQD